MEEQHLRRGTLSKNANSSCLSAPCPVVQTKGGIHTPFKTSKTATLEEILSNLHREAKKRGLEELWNTMVYPWILDSKIQLVCQASAEVCKASTGPRNVEAPAMASSSEGETAPAPAPADVPRTEVKLEDLVAGEVPEKPWQFEKYSSDRALWQGAAMRRRMHMRRSDVLLGVCCVDLSGPHEPTPRLGKHISKDQCYYFLALTVRPDETAVQCDASVQTGEQVPEVEPPEAQESEIKRKLALIYAALLGSKGEATKAVQHLLAQVNNDHANIPTEVIFRVHSDQGLEFMSQELKDYCAMHGIHNTTTTGYDPNASASA